MEPNDPAHRLNGVTAQTHGSDRAHETHDRLLVARFATGDALAGDEAATVRALLASCTACTDLVVELQLVQRVTTASLAPSRPRDFFLTPQQADTLRPGVWQRFLDRFSAPRATVLRPLAGATLAMGIVLVGAGAVLPRSTDVPASEAAPTTADASPDASGSTAMRGQFADAPADPQVRQMDLRSGGPEAKATPAAGGTEMVLASPGAMMLTVPASPEADASPTAVRIQAPDTAGDAAPMDMAAMASVADGGQAAGTALLILGVLLAAVSALVLVLAWLARRATDPLLR